MSTFTSLVSNAAEIWIQETRISLDDPSFLKRSKQVPVKTKLKQTSGLFINRRDP